MAYRKDSTGELVRTDPKAAAAVVRSLVKVERGNLVRVAQQLAVDYRTLLRWLRALEAVGFDLRPYVEQQRDNARSVGRSWYRPAGLGDRRRRRAAP